jgi:hypothetical protein
MNLDENFYDVPSFKNIPSKMNRDYDEETIPVILQNAPLDNDLNDVPF